MAPARRASPRRCSSTPARSRRLGTVEAGTTTLDWDPDEHKRNAEHQPRDRLPRARRVADHDRRHARLRRLPGRCGRGTGSCRCRDRRDRRLRRGRGRHRGGLAAGRRARPAADDLHQQDGPRERELRRDPRRSSRPASARRSRRSTCRSAPPSRSAATSTSSRSTPTSTRAARRRRCRSPTELEGIEHSRRDALVEAAAEASDELMMKYLEGEPLHRRGDRGGAPQGHPRGLGRAGLRRLGDAEHRRPRADQHDRQARPLPRRGRHAHDRRRQGDRPRPERPVRGAGLQGHRRPVRRPAHLLPRHLAARSRARVTSTTPTAGRRSAIGNLLAVQGKDQENLPKVGPGDIAAVAKLTSTAAGDTLVADRAHAVELPPLDFPAPSLQVAIEPESKADLDKLGQALHRLAEEEPAIRIHREDGTGETILTAMGDAHVDVIVDRLKRKFGASVTHGDAPRAVPRDDPAGGAHRQQVQAPDRRPRPVRARRHRVRAGRDGHRLRSSATRSSAAWCRSSTSRPSRRACARRWPRASWPATRWSTSQATLVDGSYHTVDSSEMAFKVAASQALKKAFDAGLTRAAGADPGGRHRRARTSTWAT